MSPSTGHRAGHSSQPSTGRWSQHKSLQSERAEITLNLFSVHNAVKPDIIKKHFRNYTDIHESNNLLQNSKWIKGETKEETAEAKTPRK